MSLMKILLVLTFGLCLAATGQAQQTTCNLTIQNAPEVRGFRLGMTLGQFKARFPAAKFGKQSFGHVRSELSVLEEPSLLEADNSTFQGVNVIYLNFVDERLVNFTIMYGNSIRWESHEQFASKVSEALKLPAAWKNSNSGGREMECSGFTISVSVNSISFTEARAFDIVEQRKKEKEERERQSFKP